MAKKTLRQIHTLYDVIAGDEVCFESLRSKTITTVDRTTNNYIFCGQYKFRKTDGLEVPVKSWMFSRISVLSEELREQIQQTNKRKSYLKLISKTNFNKLTDTALADISLIIKKELEQ